MTTAQLLRAARAMIDTPEKFHQGNAFKRREDGGTSFCSIGAIGAAGYRESDALMELASDALRRAAGVPFIWRWSDSTPWAEVIATFDRAIANEEAREQEHACEPLQELVAV